MVQVTLERPAVECARHACQALPVLALRLRLVTRRHVDLCRVAGDLCPGS